MPKPYDATLKVLLEESPSDWPALIGRPEATAEVIDADTSTVSGAAVRVLRVSDVGEWIMHVEFQAGPDATIPARTNVYNAVLENRHGLPVRSAVVLLRPEANLRAINGVYERQAPGEPQPYRTFRYEVIRVWELPPDRLLHGGPGLLPLATLSAVTAAELPGVLHQIKERAVRLGSRDHERKLWIATYVLMGLRFEEIMIDNLLKEVMGMEESVTYQAIIRKGLVQGRCEEARSIIIRLGERRYGTPPGATVKDTLERIKDLDRLETILDRVHTVGSWDELLPARP